MNPHISIVQVIRDELVMNLLEGDKVVMLNGREVHSYKMVPSLQPYGVDIMCLNHESDKKSVDLLLKNEVLIGYMYLIGECGLVRIKEQTPYGVNIMCLNHASDKKSVDLLLKNEVLIGYMYLIGECGLVRIKEQTP